jgi:transcriptional regulator with XRE-family HTH domain
MITMTKDPITERRLAFGQALRVAMEQAGVSQTELAKHVGLTQAGVSEWVLGNSEPKDREITYEIERFLGVPPGFLSRHLNYLPASLAVAGSVEKAIAEDPQLSDEMKRALLAAYHSALPRSKPSRRGRPRKS